MRLGRALSAVWMGCEHPLQTVHFLQVTDTAQGLAIGDAGGSTSSRACSASSFRAGAGIERIVIEPGKPARDITWR
ncbi:MAG: hypothetical protein HPM95_19450 [Alphaproteobacteria bacterium]|nr:hypothetical protein [Alphaproteobacteria bacterium]